MNGTEATKRVEQTNGYLWTDFPKSRTLSTASSLARRQAEAMPRF